MALYRSFILQVENETMSVNMNIYRVWSLIHMIGESQNSITSADNLSAENFER